MLTPLGLIVGVACLALIGVRRHASEAGVGWIDPGRLAPAAWPSWADPRWREELEDLLADCPEVSTEDTEGQALLADLIAELSFVSEARAGRVLWPDGLELELELRRPVACVPVGHRYRLVAEDGTLLSGLWPVPPRIGARWLPVIGPLSDGEELFPFALAGDWLVEDEHVSALDVALSMRTHLDDLDCAQLGRVLIDATDASCASVDNPGIRLYLEERRLCLFGRGPYCGEPGELPAAAKWTSLQRALERVSDDPERDWAVVDVRWDRPELVLRRPSEELLAQGQKAPGPTTFVSSASRAGSLLPQSLPRRGELRVR